MTGGATAARLEDGAARAKRPNRLQIRVCGTGSACSDCPGLAGKELSGPKLYGVF